MAVRGGGSVRGLFLDLYAFFGIVTTVLCVVDVVYRLGGASE